MYSESFAKRLSYKLRELELVVRQLSSEKDLSGIDIDLALDKTRELYDILLKIRTGWKMEPALKEDSEAAGKSVVPTDPETVEREKVFQPEGVIPDPAYHRKKQSPVEDARATDDPEPTQAGIEKPEEQEEHEPVQSEMDRPEKNIPGDTAPHEQAKTDKAVNESSGRTEPGQPDNDKTGKKGRGAAEPGEIEIVADRYQSSQNYINKVLAEKKPTKDISTKLQSKPISDLRNSIGMNEKFLFIKELFKGRPEQYNRCIDELNRSTTFEEALSYIRENHSWEEDSEVFEKLINLLRRKHQAE